MSGPNSAYAGGISAILAFVIGGVSGPGLFTVPNFVNAIIMGLSTGLGLVANFVITPDNETAPIILDDARILYALYTGVIYTAGYALTMNVIPSARLAHSSLIKDFGYGLGLSYASYFFTLPPVGPGIGSNYKDSSSSAKPPPII